MQAVTFMSHNSAAFYTILSLYFLITTTKKSRPFGAVISALSLIMLFQTRPLTFLVIVSTFSLYFLYLLIWRKTNKKNVISFFLALLVGGLLVALLNIKLYGSLWNTPYLKTVMPRLLLGTSKQGSYTYLAGLLDAISYLWTLRLVYFPGLPLLFSTLPLLAFLRKQHYELAIFSVFNIVLIALAYTIFDDPWGLFYGPRFWYEMLPFLTLLIAIALYNLKVYFANVSCYRLFVALLISFIVARSIFGWSFGKTPLWQNLIYFTPSKIEELKGFNYVDNRLIALSQKMNIHHVVIFVRDCGGNWWCYGSVFPQNTPSLDGNIVWARDLNVRNIELKKLYPDRDFYLADYNTNSIESYIFR